MKEMEQGASPAELESDVRARALLEEIRSRGLDRVAHLLAQESEATVATLLTLLPERDVAALLPTLEADRRTAILKSVSPKKRDRWLRNPHYPEETVGYLMEPVGATFAPDTTVREAVEELRDLVKHAFITYGYVVDGANRLIGVLIMRDLLLAEATQRVRDVMIERPFALRAMEPRARHYALGSYPALFGIPRVC